MMVVDRALLPLHYAIDCHRKKHLWQHLRQAINNAAGHILWWGYRRRGLFKN